MISFKPVTSSQNFVEINLNDENNAENNNPQTNNSPATNNNNTNNNNNNNNVSSKINIDTTVPYRILSTKNGDEYKLNQEKLGSGAFANVYRGFKVSDEAVVAIKVIPKLKLSISKQDKDKDLSQIENTNKLTKNLNTEIKFLKNTNHDNIVKLHDYCQTTSRIYLIFEYCECDLQKYIEKKQKLSQTEALIVLRQIANGLRYLRNNSVVHRDLKPSNLLLQAKEPLTEADKIFPYNIKLADFSFMRFLSGTNLADTICGTPKFMAPEVLKNKKYDSKVDLWSVGTILYEMIAGINPFKGYNVRELHQTQNTDSEIINEIINREKNSFSPIVFDLVKRLLNTDPDQRITWTEFFDHPLITKSPFTFSQDSALIKEESNMEKFYQCENGDSEITQHVNNNPNQNKNNNEEDIDLDLDGIPKGTKIQNILFNNNDDEEIDFVLVSGDEKVWSIEGQVNPNPLHLGYEIDKPGTYDLQIASTSVYDFYANSFAANISIRKARNLTVDDKNISNIQHTCVSANRPVNSQFTISDEEVPATISVDLTNRWYWRNTYSLILSRVTADNDI